MMEMEFDNPADPLWEACREFERRGSGSRTWASMEECFLKAIGQVLGRKVEAPKCVQPDAPVVKCYVCGEEVHTCERETGVETVPDCNDYTCPVHEEGGQYAGKFVCSDHCYDLAPLKELYEEWENKELALEMAKAFLDVAKEMLE